MAPRSRITRSSSATPAKRKPTRETITISDSESDEIQAPAPKRVKGKGKAVPAVIYDEELSVEDVTDPRTTLACHRSLFLGPTVCPCSLSLSPATPATPFSFDDKETDFLAKSIVQCDSKCQKFVCRGCAAYIEHFDAGKCCAEGRAIVIFEVSLHSSEFVKVAHSGNGQVLAALDTLYLVDGRLSKKDDTPGVVSKGRKTAKPKGLGGGTGYGTSSVHGAAHPMMTQAMFDAMEGAYDDEDDEGEFGDFDDFDEYEEAMMMEEAGYHRGLAPAAAPFISKDADKHKEQDRLITIALNLLANLLPHPDSPDALGLDFMPSATLTPLLLLSTLPEILSDLCRNDSVTDWAQRSDLYFAMLRVLAAICEEAGTVAVFFGERRGLLWSEGIGKWMAGEGEIEWTREAAPVVKTTKRKAKGPPPTSARPVLPVLLVTPLFSLFSSLIQQATAFRKLAGSSDGAFGAEDSALLGICGDICDTGEKCKRTLAVWEQIQERERVVVVENGKGKEVSADDYASFCRLHSYSQDVSLSATTDDKITWPTHKYAKEITSIAQSRRGNVAFVHLVKELAVLSTSLPSGIFVRVDESRIDVIKCLIAGPVDTPYAGGLFEFDIFIPLRSSSPCPMLLPRLTLGDCRVPTSPSARLAQDYRLWSRSAKRRLIDERSLTRFRSSIQSQPLRRRQDLSLSHRDLARSTGRNVAS